MFSRRRRQPRTSLHDILHHPRILRRILQLARPNTPYPLRLTSKPLSRLLSASRNPHLFSTLRLHFTATSLSPLRLSTLPPLAPHTNRLIITIPHTPTTTLTLPFRPNDSLRTFTLHPTPAEGAFHPSTGAYFLSTPPFPDLGPLFKAASNTASFVALFRALRGVQELVIRCPGTPAGALRRSVVDEALISIRTALEAVETKIVRFEYAGFIGGLGVLAPGVSWEGKGMRTGWWERVRRVAVTVEAWEGLERYEKGVVERGMRLFFRGFQGCDGVWVECTGGEVECPVLDMLGGWGMGELRLRGWRVRWEGQGGLKEFLRAAEGCNVVKLKGVKFVEGDEGWRGLYGEWEMDRCGRRPGDELSLVRKEMKRRGEGGDG